MKKYHVFCGYTYYPGGGMHDYASSYPSLELAKAGASFEWATIGETQPDGSIRMILRGEHGRKGWDWVTTSWK